MTYYCIKHIPTGHVIPCANGRLDRGGSWVEPVPANACLPRVFTQKRYARGWLTGWLKGAVAQHVHADWETGYVDDVRNVVVPKPHRKRDEYKIVTISFRIGK